MSDLSLLSVEIDNILSNLQLCNTQFTSVSNRNEKAPWKDAKLNKSIGQLKVAAECVSGSMTKLQLVSSNVYVTGIINFTNTLFINRFLRSILNSYLAYYLK